MISVSALCLLHIILEWEACVSFRPASLLYTACVCCASRLLTLFPPLCLSQDLEQKLCLQEQDAAVVKSMKSELLRLPRMERELKRLREENAHLR